MSDEKEIKEYRTKIRKYIKTVPSNLIKMWRTDNNGQIAQNNTSNSIWKWTIANINENGNGENFYKTLEENNLCCVNTFFTPPENKQQNRATWDNYDGARDKQIDFFSQLVT